VEFLAEYEAARDGRSNEPAKPSAPARNTLAWLIDRYRLTAAAWASLSPATRKQREAIFVHIIEAAGDRPISAITRRKIVEGRDRRRDTPAAARHYINAMRGLFAWAVDAGLVAENPVEGVKPPRQPRTEGFEVWTPEDVAAFEARWPVGTRARVAFDVLR
jgi:integrase